MSRTIDLDVNSVIDRLSAKVAELTKENAILSAQVEVLLSESDGLKVDAGGESVARGD